MSAFRRLAFSLCATLLSHQALADGYNWEFAGWQGGGCYPNVEFDPNIKNRIYLTSDVAGLWRSDDNGDHWRFITRGLSNLDVAQIALSKTSPGIAYAATKSGLFVSKNAGDSWTEANNLAGRITFERPGSYRGIAVNPNNSKSLCVGTEHGEVFCSKDEGHDWVDLKFMDSAKSGTTITALQYLFDRSGLIAASAEGIKVYNFAKESWSTVNPVIPDATDVVPVGKEFIGAAGGRLWRSDSSALKWRPITASLDAQVFRVEYDARTDRLYAGWNSQNGGWTSGIFASGDQGRSWSALGDRMMPDIASSPTRTWAASASNITSLKASPFDPKVIFRTDWWGVWRSNDQGETWNEKVAGAPNTVGSDLAVSNDGVLYSATMDDGLLQSRDMGRSYTALIPSKAYRADVSGHMWRVGLAGKNRLIITSSPWNEPINQLILSDDGGLTYRLARSGLPATRPKVNTLWGEGYPRGLAIDPRDSRRIYLGIDGDDGGGLFISTDGGETWSRSRGQPGSLRVFNGLAIDPVDPNTIYWGAVGSDGGIYRSRDRGQTWTLVFQNIRAVFDISTLRDGAIYASGDDRGPKLYVSRDHGETWQLSKEFSGTGTAKAVTQSPVDGQMLAVTVVDWSSRPTPYVVYVSNDQGKTWIDVSGNLPPGTGAIASAFSADGKYIYISRFAGGIYRFDLGQITKQ